MMEQGFQPQLLFTDLVLEQEERAALLRAVLKAEPAFRPPPQAASPVNTSVLLEDVYSKVSPRREAGSAPPASGRLNCRHRAGWCPHR